MAHGSIEAQHYDELVALVPDARYIFMNHGYLDPREPRDAAVPPEHAAFRYSANLVRRLVRGLALADRSVLDVGAGRGGTAAYLGRAGARRVVGLDYCLGHVQFCRRVHVAPNVAFVCGDAHALPFADASFDVVTNIESSHCYPDIVQFFREVRRVLRTDGTFCYTDNVNRQIVTATQRCEQLRAAGLEILEQMDITNYVAAGVAAAAGPLTHFFVEAIDPQRKNAHRIADLIHSVTLGAFTLYATRRFDYWMWRLRPVR